MTDEQLEQVKEFAKSFDLSIDQFHDSRHAELTARYALLLAKEYPETDLKILEAACWLHDIGRINVEEGHPHESAKLAKPFLEKIHIAPEEAEAILHAVEVHSLEDIHTAKTLEAKLLFDADKIQIMSVFGFIRMVCYLVAINKLDFIDAVEKRWNRVQEVWEYMQTDQAKEMLHPEIEKIEKLVRDFRSGLHGTLD